MHGNQPLSKDLSHELFSLTDYERHRNQAILEVQGNRNPLIDHPEWAEHIKFSRGLG